MVVLLIIFIFLSLWYFAVQAIYMPNYKHDIRYKLYAKRDELRRLIIDSKIDNEEFSFLDQYISNLIIHTGSINVFDIFISKVKMKPEALNKIEYRVQKIKGCSQENYVEIKSSVDKIALDITFRNLTVLLPYILCLMPLLLIYVLIIIGRKKMKAKLSSSVQKFGVLNENEFSQLTIC